MTDVNGGKKVNVVITKHAEKRCKERNGWKRSASRRMAMKALVNGTPSESTEGELHFWIRERKDNDDSKLYYVFGNHLYIYTTKQETKKEITYILITVIPINQKLLTKHRDTSDLFESDSFVEYKSEKHTERWQTIRYHGAKCASQEYQKKLHSHPSWMH